MQKVTLICNVRNIMNTNKNNKKDSLGDRMKGYENITRTHLIPRSYTFARIDGRAFHSYLRGAKKPFDGGIIQDMNNTAIYLCEKIQNAKLAYVQSDEITVLICDFEAMNTSQFFGGNIQKMASVIASMATAKFNQLRSQKFIDKKSINLLGEEFKLAEFDCRVWNVPSRWEAVNTLIWRNQDCIRNSVSMVAQNNFSHRELQGKSMSDMHEMLHQKGINWATDFSDEEKNGRLIVKEDYVAPITEWKDSLIANPITKRSRWISKGAWKFTEDKDKLLSMIPKYE